MMASEPIQPTTIESLTGAVPKAYALLAGLQLDVFTALQDGPLTVDELARTIRSESRRLASLLHYLVPTGLLTMADGRFANTPEADRWLVRGRPGSLTTSTAAWSGFFRAYSKAAESIRAGHSLAQHDYAVMTLDDLTIIHRHMEPGARLKGEWLADTFDWSTCETLVDVGGGSGGLSVALTARCPRLRATIAELPSVVPLTEQFLMEAGATGRVRGVSADVLAGPPPGSYDAAVLSHLVQLFEPEDAYRILRHVASAVRPGGSLYLFAFALEDSRLGPTTGLWFDFISISFYEHAHAYTESEYREWLEEAGFGEIEFRWSTPVAPLAIIARKLG